MNKTLPSAFLALALAALPVAAQQEAPFVDSPKGAFVDTDFKPDSITRVVMDATVQSDTEFCFEMWSVDRLS